MKHSLKVLALLVTFFSWIQANERRPGRFQGRQRRVIDQTKPDSLLPVQNNKKLSKQSLDEIESIVLTTEELEKKKRKAARRRLKKYYMRDEKGKWVLKRKYRMNKYGKIVPFEKKPKKLVQDKALMTTIQPTEQLFADMQLLDLNSGNKTVRSKRCRRSSGKNEVSRPLRLRVLKDSPGVERDGCSRGVVERLAM